MFILYLKFDFCEKIAISWISSLVKKPAILACLKNADTLAGYIYKCKDIVSIVT